MRALSFCDALAEATRQEMERDPSVFVYGIGVPDHKKIFGSTAGLLEQFGPDRCFDTPLCEETMTGFGLGAAIAGMRPIHIHIRVDFLLLAMNQLVKHAAKLHYMSGGQLSVPLVVRAQGGVAGGWGAHHSQSLESWFLHVPGLKVVAPSTPADAGALLKAAIRDDNPVLFLEHRGLYFRQGEVDGTEELKLGSARVVRPGTDVTIVAYLRMVSEALEAAQTLEGRGISAEVVDLRSLSPLDMETLLESVSRTHRLVVAHEGVVTGGVGAEVAARVQEEAFDALDAPIQRVGAPFAPVPASPVLEEAFLPGRAAIVSAVERTLG